MESDLSRSKHSSSSPFYIFLVSQIKKMTLFEENKRKNQNSNTEIKCIFMYKYNGEKLLFLTRNGVI